VTIKAFVATCIAGLIGLSASEACAQSTLERVRSRGQLICATSQGVPGFSLPNTAGEWEGFDIDICRAVAAAIFNDPKQVKFVPVATKDRFTVLQTGEVDLVSRQATWTLGRDAGLGLNFTAVNYYDGQGFMVNKKLNISGVKELEGASICVSQGTTSELNLADYFRTRNMKYEVVAFVGSEEAFNAYTSGRCDAVTNDTSVLASYRSKLKEPDQHVILGEIISKEPVGPWVRNIDDQWLDLVRWTVFALLNAEELGVTRANVQDMKKSDNPEIRRLLGVEGKFGELLGVTNDWVVRMVSAVGNYGESFDRNLGEGSSLKLARGPNRLWTQGGYQFAPPVR